MRATVADLAAMRYRRCYASFERLAPKTHKVFIHQSIYPVVVVLLYGPKRIGASTHTSHSTSLISWVSSMWIRPTTSVFIRLSLNSFEIIDRPWCFPFATSIDVVIKVLICHLLFDWDQRALSIFPQSSMELLRTGPTSFHHWKRHYSRGTDRERISLLAARDHL